MAAQDFQVTGKNSKALFTLKVHRGDGMALLAMNWKKDKPTVDFVGFAIEYREPNSSKFWPLQNRIRFPKADGSVDPSSASSLSAPFQKFRWVHFPLNADLPGEFTYRVTPLFMDSRDVLSRGEAQDVDIRLSRETYPDKLNVTFTRGFVSSQAFVQHYEKDGKISTLVPAKADDGLRFKPTHKNAAKAHAWMGFEARSAILALLDEAIADQQADVRVVAYDLSEPEIVTRLEKLKGRLRIIIDDSGTHGPAKSGESQAEKRLKASAGAGNVKRQHVGDLQHNKTIAVDGPKVKAVCCGSTNFSWRGLYVQSNNALIVRGKKAAKAFFDAFDDYWNRGTPAAFGATGSADWQSLGVAGVDASVSFSPHGAANARLAAVASDIQKNTTSSLFYSLAFLYQTPGAMKNAIKAVTGKPKIFVYGISDRKVGGLDVLKPNGKRVSVNPEVLAGKGVPEPFKSEPVGGSGVRMHHKFLVVDFDQPTARVYLGSYNFSIAADGKNGENLLLIRDRRVAVSYAIEALRMFDHYHFRVTQKESKSKRKAIQLRVPPRKAGEKPWWTEYWTDARKIQDRELFS